MARSLVQSAQLRGKDRASIALLVAVNLLPIAGVLFLDWDVGGLLILYWSENLVIGFYGILRVLISRGVFGLFPACFFLVHYGAFCAVHGLFILEFSSREATMGMGSWPFFLVFLELLISVVSQVLTQAPAAWLWAFAALFVSHGVSFLLHFLLGPERDRMTAAQMMAAPYKRMIVLHVAIIAGGFAIAALGEPLFLLLVLVFLKIAIDLTQHRREHSAFQEPYIDSEHIHG